MRKLQALTYLAVMLAAGCGGGHRGAVVAARGGRATLKIKWPASAARLVPVVSQSIVIDLKQGTAVVASQTIDRPAASASFTGLPYGDLDVAVRLYSAAGGAGALVATGAATLSVREGIDGTVTVAPESTIKSLAITPSTLNMSVGSPVTLTATARDRDGAIVPLATGTPYTSGWRFEPIQWSTSAASVVTVSTYTGGSNFTAFAVPQASGTATLTARFKADDAGSIVEASASVVVAGTDPGTGLASGGWPIDGGDEGGDGAARGPSAAGTLAETLALGTVAGRASTVVGADGTLYAQSAAKLLARGGTNWEVAYSTAGPHSLALTATGALIVSRASKVESRSAATGELRWGVSLTNERTVAVGRDGTVYVATGNSRGPHTLVALDPTTGVARWTVTTPATDGRLVIGDDGTVFARGYATNGTTTKVYAFDPQTGAQRWAVNDYGNPNLILSGLSDLTVVGDTVYVKASFWSILGQYGTRAAYVVALNAANGALRWASPAYSYTFDGTATFGGEAVGGALAVRSGRVYAQWHGHAAALDTATGDEIWSVADGGSETAVGGDLATAADGTVYVRVSGSLKALDPSNGRLRWSLALPAAILPGPAALAADGTVYLPDDRTVYVVR